MEQERFFGRVAALVLALALSLQLPSTAHAAGSAVPSGHQLMHVESGGMTRQYLLHLPSGYTKGRLLPLVIMLHGMGGSGVNAVRETGWSAMADAENFIVAYPDASRPDPDRQPSLRNNAPDWNDGSGRFHAGERGIDDVAFIRALIDRLAAEHPVDRRKIYVTGFSNGASMAFRVGAELSDQVAAIAPVAGASWLENIQPKRPISLIYITGTADPLNPLDGGYPKMAFGGREQGGKPKAPVVNTMAAWAQGLGCEGTEGRDKTADGVRTREFGSCRDSAEVRLVTVEGLGHIWAGGENLLPEFLVGKPTDKLNATRVIWDFFLLHPAR